MDINELLEEISKPGSSSNFQLPQAAQTLCKFKMSPVDQFEPPFGWAEKLWIILCNSSYEDRISYCLVILSREADRIKEFEKAGIDLITLKKIEDETSKTE